MLESPATGLAWLDDTSLTVPLPVTRQAGEGAATQARLRMAIVGVGRPDALRLAEEGDIDADSSEATIDRGEGALEWWRSLPEGLEHGLDLRARPEGAGPLIIDVDVGPDVSVRNLSSTSVAMFAGRARVARYDGLVVSDARGTRLPAHMAASSRGLRITVDDELAQYPLVVDPILAVEEAELTPSGSPFDSRFGIAVSMAADESRLLVGAFGQDAARGSARVFARTGGSWTEEAALQGLPAAPDDRFGWSVAMNADGSRVAVGAPLSDVVVSDGGAVWIFSRTGTTWTEEAQLFGIGGASDELGSSVAISADGTRVVAGLPLDEPYIGGSAFVWAYDGSTWQWDAWLWPTELTAGARFGHSVAISGDGTRILIGARDDDTMGGEGAGSASVFVWSGSSWSEEAKLVAEDGAAGDGFGMSVALSANGDRAFVGAWHDDAPAGDDAGSVRVFARVGSVWTAEASLLGSGEFDLLGSSVSASGDGALLAAGAWGDDTFAGSARLFTRSGSAWTADVTLQPAGLPQFFGFGRVSLGGSGERLLVGAPGGEVASVFTLEALATACASSADCGGGPCVDGYCCNDPCSGGQDDCLACSIAAGGSEDGICTPRVAGAGCSDGSVCTTGDVCDAAGSCQGGPALSCDDGNECSTDDCDPAVGCTTSPLPAGTDCDDDDACTTSDQCNDAGTCVGGVLDCSDAEECTIDGCDPSLGCTHEAAPDGTPCDSGDGRCSGGTCILGEGGGGAGGGGAGEGGQAAGGETSGGGASGGANAGAAGNASTGGNGPGGSALGGGQTDDDGPGSHGGCDCGLATTSGEPSWASPITLLLVALGMIRRPRVGRPPPGSGRTRRSSIR